MIRSWQHFALLFLGGVLFTASFAPLRWHWLAIPCLLLLLSSIYRRSDSAGLAGFIFGFGQFLSGVSWIYVSLVQFGNMSALLAVLAVILFVSYLSLFPALAGYLFKRMQRRFSSQAVAQLILIFPLLWVFQEFARAWVFTGFPWLITGYSQSGSPLAGYAPVIGVYGISWLSALCASLLWLFFSVREKLRWLFLLLVVMIFTSGLWLRQVHWVDPSGEPLQVAVVQGNIPLRDKWKEEHVPSILAGYLATTQALDAVDLVIWPEAAVPDYADNIPPEFMLQLKNHSAAVMFGVVERQSVIEAGLTDVTYYNSVFLVHGGQTAVYRKRHLVPFGEYLPLRSWLFWLLDYLQIPMSNFSAWQGESANTVVRQVPLGISICYEDAFQRDALQSLPHSRVLVNVSEDAWFGDSIAPHQRIQMAQVRAMESGRPMLRAANTGVSAIIDADGIVRSSTPQFEKAVLQGEVQPMTGATPFVAYGNLLLLFSMFLFHSIGYFLLNRWPLKAKIRSLNRGLPENQ